MHGVSEWQPPETQVAWRKEVEIVTGELLTRYDPADLLEDFPLKPHEILKDNSKRIFDRLQKLESGQGKPIWIVASDGTVEVTSFDDLIQLGRGAIEQKVLLLPPSAGGIENGMLATDSAVAEDVSEEWLDERGEKRRIRIWDDEAPPTGMRRIRQPIDIQPDAEDTFEDDESEPDGTAPRRFWNWYELTRQGDSDGSKSSNRPVAWDVHVKDVVARATHIVNSLAIPEQLKVAIIMAAQFHDHGKRRKRFQNTLGNFCYPEVVLAKSGKSGGPIDDPYRHEFGSLLDVESEPAFKELDPSLQNLVRHLIAVHHGFGRPHFPNALVYDPEAAAAANLPDVGVAVSQRFGEAQHQFGRWGLAYLESLLRAADYAASAEPSEFVKEWR